MDILAQAQIIFLRRLIAAYERERQFDHPGYHAALQELTNLQVQTDHESNQRPESNIMERFDSPEGTQS